MASSYTLPAAEAEDLAGRIFGLVFDPALKAGVRLIAGRHPQSVPDADILSAVAGPVLHRAIDTVLAEWGAVAEATVSEEALRAFVAAQVTDLAWAIADAYTEELFWS